MRIKRQNLCSEADADGKWAGSRETKPRLRSRKNFFLDIPFDRTHRPPFSLPRGELTAAVVISGLASCLTGKKKRLLYAFLVLTIVHTVPLWVLTVLWVPPTALKPTLGVKSSCRI